MDKKSNKREKFLKKLQNKYRLVLMNDETFEEKLSFRLTRLNVFVFFGTFSILLIIATTYLIAFTPLREYIPGYADFNTRKVLHEMMIKTDSLERELSMKDTYIRNIRGIVEGRDLIEKEEIVESRPGGIDIKSSDDIEELPRSREDSILRAKIENQSQYGQWSQVNISEASSKDLTFMFPPIKGIITNHFNPKKNHYGVDIVADKNEAIKATLDGTVIFSNWTLETGYTIGIQHSNNLISIYKHNSALLKNVGAPVRAGEVIAIIGETGFLSTGTHLHFELWHNGRPVNPVDYIAF